MNKGIIVERLIRCRDLFESHQLGARIATKRIRLTSSIQIAWASGLALKMMFRDLVVLQHLPKRGVRLWSVVRIGVHHLLFKEVGDRVSLRTGTGTSNQFGVPKGTRTYVDAKTPRNNRDRGLSLPLADGGFNVIEVSGYR